MVRGLLGNVVARSLSAAGKWQQQQIRRLNMHEYQGAEVMGAYGVNVPKGVVVSSVEQIKKAIPDTFHNEKELVVKSQILAGGRRLGTFQNGLKGGVHIVKTEDVESIAGKMLGQILVTKQTGPQGEVVSKVYLCEKLQLVNEMCLAITRDRTTAGPIILACRKGGTSIEDLAEKFPDMIIKFPIDVFKGITYEDAAKVVDGLALKVADRNKAIEQVKNLYRMFCEWDCTLLEINPIVETSDNQFVAVYAKLNFDNSAASYQRGIFGLPDRSQEKPREVLSSVLNGNDGGDDDQPAVYIVFVQKPPHMLSASPEELERWHRSFLPTANLPSGKPRMIDSFSMGNSVIVTWLNSQEVQAIKTKEGVLQVLPGRNAVLCAPPSCSTSDRRYCRLPTATRASSSAWWTGIDPTHVSFDDAGYPPPPARWQGFCDNNQRVCNNKLFGVRNLDAAAMQVQVLPMDTMGNDTHVASTAGENEVLGANIRGMA